MTVRRSVVGTRLDVQQSLELAEAGKVKAMVAKEKLDNINDVFARMHMREIEGAHRSGSARMSRTDGLRAKQGESLSHAV